MNIFLVSTGERVQAVFNTEELAQKYIKAFDVDDARIETYELNPHEEQIRQDFKSFFIRMDKDGNVLNSHQNDSMYNFPFTFDIRNNYVTTVFARDEEQAIKIVNEQRIGLLAAEQWPPDHKRLSDKW